MFKHIEILDSNKHKNLKLTNVSDCKFASQQQFAPITYTEFDVASKEYPIVFPLATEEESTPLPVVLLGITEKNCFVDSQGQWQARYIPAHIRRYPFILGASEDKNTYHVMIDTQAPSLSEEQGEPLFTEGGEQTETLKNMTQFLTLFQQEVEKTRLLVKELRAADVMTERQVQQQEGQSMVAGFETVDKEKFDAISDEQFIKWRKNGMLPLIYAHLSSLDNIQRLAEDQ